MPYRAILDSLDEGVITLDDAGTVIWVNRAACEILEVERDEAIRRGCPCLLGDDLCDPASALRRSIADGRPLCGIELDFRTESGHRKVLSIRTSEFRDEHSATHGGLVVFHDMTELVRLRRDLEQRYDLHNMVGKSKAMQEIFRLVEEVADSDATVLIEGETGTGKELVARAIHHLGPRSEGPFVAVNCSALSEGLLESELFGHVRGAFTGALRDKEGRFETAAGGTIFLDEIGEMSPTIQVKLLRVLQDHTIERVGGEKPVAIDIRVMTATNSPLTELVGSGKFREDLYYRLHVVPVQLPPLRERRDDIPLLAQHFVEKFRDETARPIEGVDEEALAVMLDHRWPGNVREVENAIEYAFVKARSGTIGVAHLPPELSSARSHEAHAVATPQVRQHGSDGAKLDREQVRHALMTTGWNVAKAARRLHVSRTTLYKSMGKFQLSAPTE